jgi:hypothetical protein
MNKKTINSLIELGLLIISVIPVIIEILTGEEDNNDCK